MDFKSRNFNQPENLFYFYNRNGEPLSFLLRYDTEDNFYAKLLERHFANVVTNLDKYSMVLSTHNENKHFNEHVPAFDIKFIEDCFTLKEIPDPTNYFIKNSCSLIYSKNDIFDCWFYHKKSWSDFPIPQNIKDNKTQLNNIDTLIEVKNESSNMDYESNETDSGSNTASISSTFVSHNTKRTRLPYSYNEEKQIVQYIIKNECAFEIFGVKMWQRMERQNVCKIRTWQSMKERFIKHIKHDLISGSQKYPFLSSKDLKLLRQGLKVEVIDDNERKKKKNKFLHKNYYSDTDTDNESE